MQPAVIGVAIDVPLNTWYAPRGNGHVLAYTLQSVPFFGQGSEVEDTPVLRDMWSSYADRSGRTM